MQPSFTKVAGAKAMLAGVSAFLYALAFLVISQRNQALGARLSALFLMLTALLTIAPLIVVYRRLRATDEEFALLALVLGVVGAAGMAVHGGFDLANAINPPGGLERLAGLPSQVDPRGLLTFGFGGSALLLISWLISQGRTFSQGLGYVAFVSGVLSVVLYLGRLTVLSPTSPVILWPAVINGFIMSPLWYLWLGVVLWRGAARTRPYSYD